MSTEHHLPSQFDVKHANDKSNSVNSINKSIQLIEVLDFSEGLLPSLNGDYYLLRVVGRTFNNTQVNNTHSVKKGDLIVVCRKTTAEVGDVAIIRVDGRLGLYELYEQNELNAKEQRQYVPWSSQDELIVECETTSVQGPKRGYKAPGKALIEGVFVNVIRKAWSGE